MAILSPSILSADYMHFHTDMDQAKADGAKWLHVDIMDGHFVPNLSFGYSWVKAMRKITDLVLDVHLMIDTPIQYAEEFCKAGADYLTIHVEADTPENIAATLDKIRALGVKPGIVVKPKTPAEAIAPYLDKVDLVLVMTVEPGFGGQALIPDTLDKISPLRDEIKSRGLDVDIEVDGGITADNVKELTSRGANVIVAGSAVCKAADPKAVLSEFKK